jgi:hypothetical protein
MGIFKEQFKRVDQSNSVTIGVSAKSDDPKSKVTNESSVGVNIKK